MCVPQGTLLGPILFSVILNDIQAVHSDKSNLVQSADDLTLRIVVKETQDQTPQEVENKISWAQNNLTTKNLTKTKEMVKLKDLSSLML